MFKRLSVLALCVLLVFSLAYAETKSEQVILAEEVLMKLQSADEEGLLAMMDAQMQGMMRGKTAGLWAQLEAGYGPFEGIVSHSEEETDGFLVVESLLRFQNSGLIQRTAFDPDKKVAGLFFRPAPAADSVKTVQLPDGLSEKDLTVTADPDYPLPGTLTLPAGEIKAGFVLVHGSGPQDRDETLFSNKPLRDLAWGLAQEGYAVLRYDKRTYTFGNDMVKSPDYPKLTVDEETALDAAAAVNTLAEQPEMAGKKVYLIGHSMGGMLASYIGTKTDQLAGYVLLAGTPRMLWELSMDQNQLAIQELSMAERAVVLLKMEAEKLKAEKLMDLSDEDALLPINFVLGMPAWYLRHWQGIDAAGLHMADGKPVLVLQGEKDRQVTMKDFALWQERLKGHPDAAFIAYPELNHLFGQYEGEEVPFSQLVTVEYAQRTPVAEKVIKDTANWAEGR